MSALLRALARVFMRVWFPQVRQLPPAQLAAWLADSSRPQPLLLDVRQPEEFAVSHLAGARRVEFSDAAKAVLENVPTTQPIVCYCAAGFRSSVMAKRLARAGHREVFNLEGAIFDWASEGRPLVCADQPTREVHPFNWLGRLLLPRGVRASAPSLRH
ncbi:MAG: rhodanese-like domain-containing protein [Verrucomicrobia bacterium]|nr:rhodanese-like domain-containing protein [Verrucomicrobiota bacterium]